MKAGNPHHVDYVVVGCGMAGLRAAIELGQAGSVLVLAKSELGESATEWAQGGNRRGAERRRRDQPP